MSEADKSCVLLDVAELEAVAGFGVLLEVAVLKEDQNARLFVMAKLCDIPPRHECVHTRRSRGID